MKFSCISKHESSYNTKALLLAGGGEPTWGQLPCSTGGAADVWKRDRQRYAQRTDAQPGRQWPHTQHHQSGQQQREQWYRPGTAHCMCVKHTHIRTQKWYQLTVCYQKNFFHSTKYQKFFFTLFFYFFIFFFLFLLFPHLVTILVSTNMNHAAQLRKLNMTMLFHWLKLRCWI